MHNLPEEVREAIRKAFGHSEHQLWKAERDAETLFRRYGLPPNEWNRLEFHRMAKDNRGRRPRVPNVGPSSRESLAPSVPRHVEQTRRD
jgi:hypothetical protein